MASTSNRIPSEVTEEGPPLVPSRGAAHRSASETNQRLKKNLARLEWVWMAAIVVLFGLHAVHLRADFPNFSPWMDYAKYTDEGWYGNAAIEAFVRGSWYVPGDFNTAVALPVWPFLEWLVFHFTGVSVAAARGLAVAVFGGNVWLTYAVVRASRRFSDGPSEIAHSEIGIVPARPNARWPALLAATMVAGSSFLYCFSRLAILEPLVTFFMLLSWLLALKLTPEVDRHRPARQSPLLIAIGVVMCLMVFTKTTAVVLLPSTFYLIWVACRDRIRACATVGLAAALPGGLYYFLLVRPHYLVDFKYLFSANVYQQPTTAGGWLMAFWYAIHGGLWIGRTLFFAGAFFMLASLIPFLKLRGLWRTPLYVAAWMSVAFQISFVGYHNNMQPRYYMVAAYPLYILVATGVASLWQWGAESEFPFESRHVRIPLARLAAGMAATVVMGGIVLGIVQTVRYVRHPEYTFVTAAQSLTRYIDQHPNGNRLLLSISGNQIGLVTGIPSICDDFGTLELPVRIHRYQPGWYAAWNELDPGSLEDIHTQFLVEQVARFPAFDDPERNVLILYKLHPKPLAQQTLESVGDPDENSHVEPDFGGDDDP